MQTIFFMNADVFFSVCRRSTYLCADVYIIDPTLQRDEGEGSAVEVQEEIKGDGAEEEEEEGKGDGGEEEEEEGKGDGGDKQETSDLEVKASGSESDRDTPTSTPSGKGGNNRVDLL